MLCWIMTGPDNHEAKVGAGEIPSVDLEKRAPMRFVVVIMFYMKITS